MPPRCLASRSPLALCLHLISLDAEHAGKSEAHNLAPRSPTFAPLPFGKNGCYDDTPALPSPLPLLTALFFYHTGNQTDSGALKPFLQLSDGDQGPRTSLMQPPSPGLVSQNHLRKKRRLDRGRVAGGERERNDACGRGGV